MKRSCARISGKNSRFASGQTREFRRSVRENEFGTAQRSTKRKLFIDSHANCGYLPIPVDLDAEMRYEILFRRTKRDFPFPQLFAKFNFSVVAEWDRQAKRIAAKRNTTNIFNAVSLKNTPHRMMINLNLKKINLLISTERGGRFYWYRFV